MISPPDINIHKISEFLEQEYDILVSGIHFLPLGADLKSSVYHVEAEGGREYFLKLRRGGFVPGSVMVPYILAENGASQFITPLKTIRTRNLTTRFNHYTIVVYPFIHGPSGWEAELSPEQWIAFGQGLNSLHKSAFPEKLIQQIPAETFSSKFQKQVEKYIQLPDKSYERNDFTIHLNEIIHKNIKTIRYINRRSENLAGILVQQPPPFCICHSDIHAGNVLLYETNKIFIVDWDTISMAPKERDLMFIGGGVGGKWVDQIESDWFYQGYGPAEVHNTALTYYRFQRIITDIAEIIELLLETNLSDEDGQTLLTHFADQFKPGNVAEKAVEADDKLAKSR